MMPDRRALLAAIFLVACCATRGTDVQHEIEAQYLALEHAYAAQDVEAILATRTQDLLIIDPVNAGDNLNYEQFAGVMRSWFVRNKPPIEFHTTIESLEPRSPDEAAVRVLQRVSRYQERRGRRVRVVHEVRQRELWTRTASGWKVRTIDEIDIRNRKVWEEGRPIPLDRQ